MSKIAVIGLGIIGGSICAALSKAGLSVDGFDLNKKAVYYALEKGYIQNEALTIANYDVVFVAVPPRATISILENTKFKDGALVSDICGIKSSVEKAVYSQPRNYRYLGIHPMAGKEISGIEAASAELFNGANLVIVLGDKTEQSSVEEMKVYAKMMHFGKIVQCTAEEHDRKIALTSQLAHIVSNAYVKSPQVQNCKGFTGGSFQDMTRIAGVDEKIWTELYMNNRAFILEELDGLLENLAVYRDAIASSDEKTLSETLKEGRLIRQNIKYKRK